MTIPVLIISRARVTPLRKLVGFLKRVSYPLRIVIVDNASTFPELLDYYQECGVEVRYLGYNAGSRGLWNTGVIGELCRECGTEYHIVSDSDVFPDEECPLDVIEHLKEFKDRYRSLIRIGLGLRIDDLPEHEFKARIRKWESRYWEERICEGLFKAGVATTFALYRGVKTEFPGVDYGGRTDFPYVARHWPWYEPLSNEEFYFAIHADEVLSAPKGIAGMSTSVKRLREHGYVDKVKPT